MRNFLRNKILLSGILVGVLSFGLGSNILAADPLSTGLMETGKASQAFEGGGKVEQEAFIQYSGGIIQSILGILGIFALLIIIYAGFLYLTAAGDSSKVDTAKKILLYGGIGLVIIFGAYSLANFAISQLGTNVITGVEVK
ncbi:MAG: Uncharacterized protein G01um101418_313 [Parcubacteria group bacterium Gr01-1014_18]|nr:MAG: Uncharacterized protein Greene041636_311 [Parcubacteria group bacterium Greene0416_36]TSC81173.1 MAG: Uncharacterized protein G01um101418_313 [Parcubacteria group bacterium Gr01-1014_18]TSC99170.1 MAG: Uncharacterized protein Greene101420_315 [Parcubacteria group bacterium Greene1014_20]TSD07472.1 MAG: Uncharacterized protein Greene07142_171 [Parcubacteria group bacterium Greene0714_2]